MTRLLIGGGSAAGILAGLWRPADLVPVVFGVGPENALARTAGLRFSTRDSIWADRSMRMGVPHIFAAGDCVHTYRRLLDRDVYCRWAPRRTSRGVVKV